MQTIEGFKIDVRADELKALMMTRADLHERKAAAIEQRANEERELLAKRTQEDAERFRHPRVAALGAGPCGPDMALEIVELYREQAKTCRFVAEHLIEGQTYRLPMNELAVLVGPMPTESQIMSSMRYGGGLTYA